jgi:hypothetical protein
MSEKTLNDILADFGPKGADDKNSLKEGKPVTIWLPAAAKARYDKLQETSGRRFSKKAREVLLALIEAAEARTA